MMAPRNRLSKHIRSSEMFPFVVASPLAGEEAKTWLCRIKALVFAGGGLRWSSPNFLQYPLLILPRKGGGLIRRDRILLEVYPSIAAALRCLTP